MPFVKVVKDKAYHKRFQVKYRRRREGKTDYHARKRLCAQAKNKYRMPKYRFVVRFSNKYVTCQIISATIKGDVVLCSAHSSELPRYGLTVGLKNYPAAYCTGLLLARRLLAQLDVGRETKLSELYVGSEEVDGEITETESELVKRKTYYVCGDIDEENARPFRCNLDVGLRPTTLGSRVFGALKGAVDGGLDIPHNHKKFPGYDPDEKEYEADAHRAKIMGELIGEYMESLAEDDDEKYKKHFAKFIEAGVTAENISELYESVHEKIREDPSPAPKKAGNYSNPKFRKPTRRSNAQRKDRVRQKIAAHKAKNEE